MLSSMHFTTFYTNYLKYIDVSPMKSESRNYLRFENEHEYYYIG